MTRRDDAWQNAKVMKQGSPHLYLMCENILKASYIT